MSNTGEPKAQKQNAKKSVNRVFISYAASDKPIVSKIAERLKQAGLDVWFDVWELRLGDSLKERVRNAVAGSDYILVILSPRSVSSRWVQHELAHLHFPEIYGRGITVLPVVIEDCKIPFDLASLKFWDLRENFDGRLEELIGQLKGVPEIDLSQLNEYHFEHLVSALLSELGFEVQPVHGASEKGFDLSAILRTRDPFGGEQRELWLVETKLYHKQRADLGSLHKMAAYLTAHKSRPKGLLVTNTQLTSVARNWLQSNPNLSEKLRVIDGVELRRLLLQYPQIVQKFFVKEPR
jgi:hypothetical protein